MKKLLLSAIFLMSYAGYAQTSMGCNGVKVKVLEATEDFTTVEVDATNFNAPVNPPGTHNALFVLVNGKNMGKNEAVGAKKKGTWKFTRTADGMALKFTSVWKTCADKQISLEPKMLKCQGITLTVQEVTDTEIKLHVDGTEFGHLVQPPGSYTSQFNLENGSCSGCKGFHANNNGYDDTGIWTITNGAGPTRIVFNGALKMCEGKALDLD